MTDDRRMTAFSFRRQRLDGSAASALEAVRAVVGVYSANPSGPLSIRVRAPRVTLREVASVIPQRRRIRRPMD